MPVKTMQFRVWLRDVEPPVWRRIRVPARYSFWDLHVALQDAMGWYDLHLHEFRFVDERTGRERATIGIPDDDAWGGDREVEPGWKVKIRDFYKKPGDWADYVYDFGDDWHHRVTLEQFGHSRTLAAGLACLAGERGCPPEDSGGAWGYQHLLAAIADPEHPEHDSFKQWLPVDWNAEVFSPGDVEFDNPRKRFATAFEDPGHIF